MSVHKRGRARLVIPTACHDRLLAAFRYRGAAGAPLGRRALLPLLFLLCLAALHRPWQCHIATMRSEAPRARLPARLHPTAAAAAIFPAATPLPLAAPLQASAPAQPRCWTGCGCRGCAPRCCCSAQRWQMRGRAWRRCRPPLMPPTPRCSSPSPGSWPSRCGRPLFAQRHAVHVVFAARPASGQLLRQPRGSVPGCLPAPPHIAPLSYASFACSLALDQLAPIAPEEVALISLSDSPEPARQAAELGYAACEHLPARDATPAQLQARALQAVAGLAGAARQAAGRQAPLVVGCVMKESRQLALEQQGMLPLLPVAEPAAGAAAADSSAAAPAAAGGAAAAAAVQPPALEPEGERPLCFVPLDVHSPLAPQLARCHIVLQARGGCCCCCCLWYSCPGPAPADGARAMVSSRSPASCLQFALHSCLLANNPCCRPLLVPNRRS